MFGKKAGRKRDDSQRLHRPMDGRTDRRGERDRSVDMSQDQPFDKLRDRTIEKHRREMEASNSSKIDYTYIHNKSCELWMYLENFLQKTSPSEQLHHEIRRAMQDVAFHEIERRT